MPSRKRARTAAPEEPDCVTLRSPNEPDALHRSLAAQRRDGKFCDVQVSVEGQHFKAHRCVLAACSGYMSSLMSGDHFADSAAPSITINDVQATVFEAALDYCYEGVCEVAESLLEELLATAARLQILDLLDVVAAELAARLGASNCLSMWSVAEGHSLPALATAACAAAARNFSVVAAADAFTSLPRSNLLALLQHEDVEVDEPVVFRAVVAWLRAQTEEVARAPEAVAELMGKVRFAIMPLEVMRAEVNVEPLMRNVPNMQVLNDNLLEKAHCLVSPRTQPRIGHRWHVSGCDPENVAVEGDVITIATGQNGTERYIPFGRAVNTGRHEYRLKLLADNNDGDIGTSTSGFGFVADDALHNRTDSDGGVGVWFLRRFETAVYIEDSETTEHTEIDFPVGAEVRMVLDLGQGDADGRATFFVNGVLVPTVATGIRGPVRPCAFNYFYAVDVGGWEPRVKIELLPRVV